jgi:hypothetical protein
LTFIADGREAFSIHNGEDHTADGIPIRTSPMIFLTGLDVIAVDESSRWFRLMSSRAETVSSYVRGPISANTSAAAGCS